jgi:hypothetical protein
MVNFTPRVDVGSKIEKVSGHHAEILRRGRVPVSCAQIPILNLCIRVASSRINWIEVSEA